MKKRLTTMGVAALMLGTGFINTSCFGEFALTRKFYTWHSDILGDDLGGRFVRTILFYIPFGFVYGITIFVDEIINIVEFWTGSNPLAMEPGDMEEQYVKVDGKRYKITATQNTFTYERIENDELIPLGQLIFDPENTSWNFSHEGETTMLYKIKPQSNGNDIIEYTDVNGNLAWTNMRSLEANYEDYMAKK